MLNTLALFRVFFLVCLSGQIFSLSETLACCQQAGSQFHGVVTDENGIPVSGAQVVLLPINPSLGKANESATQWGTPTDKDGKFSIPIDTGRSWTGMVYKKGFAPAFKTMYSSRLTTFAPVKAPRPQKFKLEKAKSISLEFFYPDGKVAVPEKVNVGYLISGSKYCQFRKGAEVPFAMNLVGNRLSMDWLPQTGIATLEIENDRLKQTVEFSMTDPGIDYLSTLKVNFLPTTKLAGVIQQKGDGKRSGYSLKSFELLLNLNQSMLVRNYRLEQKFA